jgi:hypothetical protein
LPSPKFERPSRDYLAFLFGPRDERLKKRDWIMRIPKILASFALLFLLATAARAEQVAAEIVIMQGDPAPGTAGLLVTGLNSPFVTEQGKVAFTGTVDNGSADGFVWLDDQVVFLNSEETSFTLSSLEDGLGATDASEFIFSVDVDSDDSMWSHGGLLLRGGSVAPGVAGATVLFNSNATMLPNGTAYWHASIDTSGDGFTDGEVLYQVTDAANPGSISVVLRSGDVVGTETIEGLNNSFSVSRNNNHLLQEVDLISDLQAVYLDGALIAREGDSTGFGETWDTFDETSVNNSGDYVFGGTVVPTRSAGRGTKGAINMISVNGAVVIRDTDSLDGVSLATNAGQPVGALKINNSGDVAFIWDTNALGNTLFAGHISDLAGTATVLLAPGDTLDINGDTNDDFSITGLANFQNLIEDGFIFVLADIDTIPSTGSIEAILRIDFPASGAATLEVNTTEGDDDGDTVTDLSLPEAIRVANSGDTITFNSSLDGGIIQLASTLVVAGKDLTIAGPGPFVSGTRSAGDSSERLIPADTGLLIVAPGSRRTAINDRHMFVDGGSTLNISGMTFMGGQAQGGDGSSSGTPSAGGGAAGMGGSFFINSGNVSLDHCDFDNNAATGGNGGSAFIFGSPGGGEEAAASVRTAAARPAAMAARWAALAALALMASQAQTAARERAAAAAAMAAAAAAWAVMAAAAAALTMMEPLEALEASAGVAAAALTIVAALVACLAATAAAPLLFAGAFPAAAAGVAAWAAPSSCGAARSRFPTRTSPTTAPRAEPAEQDHSMARMAKAKAAPFLSIR